VGWGGENYQEFITALCLPDLQFKASNVPDPRGRGWRVPREGQEEMHFDCAAVHTRTETRGKGVLRTLALEQEAVKAEAEDLWPTSHV
jgi:hypothetical protein